jgi:hypothetical protein
MISKTKPKNLAAAEVVEIKKGLPLQYLGGKYLVDLNEYRWKSFFVVTLFKAIVRKFELMSDFEMNRVFDYILWSTSNLEEVIKELNKYVGKHVIFFYGSGKKISMPLSSDSDTTNSVSSLDNNLKKLTKIGEIK